MIARPSVEEFVVELGADVPDREVDVRIPAGVRAYLAATRTHLETLHRGAASGEMVNRSHADAVDRLVRRLVRVAEGIHHARGGELGSPVAIAAVGGYGRREMAIHSDVDLLFLHAGELSAHGEAIAKRVQLWLWDANVAVGGAVRSLDETLALGREEASVCTAILDARFLSGDTALFHEFGDRVRRELLDDPERFVAERWQALRERHAKFGDSLYLLQPNVKEGAGGLRDYHTAWWAASALVPSLRSVEDLLHVGLFSETEMDEYGAALDFLWRVRNEMHLVAGRKSDQMGFELQEQIAQAFAYEEDESELPVERFMGAYYRHARVVSSLSEVVISQSAARAAPQVVRPPTREVEEGFRLAEDHLEIPHAAHLRQRPVRLLRAFAVAQDHQVPLSRTALRLVRDNLDAVDDGLRHDPEAAATLLRILDSEHRVMRSLMAMNECGLLGRYLPEWEHIVCRWQHVMHHTYTVDVHSIFLVEELRRLWRGKYAKAHPELTELVRSVADRPALFLGALLHDIGKGLGGDHSNKGEGLARRCLERLGFDPERIDRIAFLVRQHLLMSHVAQRRDLSDPRVVVEMARVAGDRENLRNLYLVTFADIRACSPTGWTEWKGQLLRELYERTAEFLESGRDDPERALEQIEARVETRRDGARRELRQLGVADAKVAAFFEMMPRRYFVSHTPRQIARHGRVLLAYDRQRPFASAVREMRGGFSEFIFCALDVPGLYANVAGCLTAAGINILGSHVYTTRTGLALEVYRVTTPTGGDEEKRLVWERLEELLGRVVAEEESVFEILKRRRRPLGATRTISHTPPSVSVSNDESDFYTIVDVSANDRLGLLYDLVHTLTEHGLEIYTSKATTILDQVADTFYVKDRKRRKLTDADAVARLQRDLFAVTRDDGEEREGAHA